MMFKAIRAAGPALLLVGALTACNRTDAAVAAKPGEKAPAVKVDPAFAAKVRAYLLANPEVLEEMTAALEVKKRETAQNKLAQTLDQRETQLLNDPRDFVANPGGKITVVEFFDYRCGYCKQAAPDVVRLIAANPDVRFVFKEFPIFGGVSDYAAHAAQAAKAKGAYIPVYKALMAEKALDRDGVDRILRANGVDPAAAQALERDPAAKAHLTEVRDLAVALGVEGTPAFIVGDRMIPGADMEGLQVAIEAERKA